VQPATALARRSNASMPHLPSPYFGGCPCPCDSKMRSPPPPHGLSSLGWPPRRRWSRLGKVAARQVWLRPWGRSHPKQIQPTVGPCLVLSGPHGPVVPAYWPDSARSRVKSFSIFDFHFNLIQIFSELPKFM
jgi:hypothetical protein